LLRLLLPLNDQVWSSSPKTSRFTRGDSRAQV